MRRAMSSLRITDPEALGRAVQIPGDARDAVLTELTVGETYFFREAQQFDVLRTHILPSLLETRGAMSPLRVWSAGCASGEEPYTVAMALRELGWSHPARILGTDVARARLDAARRGRYTRWSLRGVSPARIERWFDKRAAHFQLDPGILASVQFSALNLVADDYPSAATETMDQDLVLCRNVLIYFDMPTVALIATRLLAALAPNGWLLLGASDPPLSELVPCEVVMTPAGVAYRRDDRDPARMEAAAEVRNRPPLARTYPAREPVEYAPLPSAAAPVQYIPVPVAQSGAAVDDASAAYAAADYPRAEALTRLLLARDAGVPDMWVLLIRSIANQGRLREADAECIRALDLHRLDPELHYVHAVLLSAADQHREAANAARRALYLDAQFVVAHLQLGDALARIGESDRAALAFENGLRELASLAEGAEVPGADGVPASRLRQLADMRLRGMREVRSA